jgi:hypothetical protein
MEPQPFPEGSYPHNFFSMKIQIYVDGRRVSVRRIGLNADVNLFGILVTVEAFLNYPTNWNCEFQDRQGDKLFIIRKDEFEENTPRLLDAPVTIGWQLVANVTYNPKLAVPPPIPRHRVPFDPIATL